MTAPISSTNNRSNLETESESGAPVVQVVQVVEVVRCRGHHRTGRKGCRGCQLHQKGLTLMEMLIYLGVMVGLVAVITNIFLVLGRGRGTVIAQGEVHRSMRVAAERIGQDLRSATSVTTRSLTGDANSTATLVLEHPDDGTVTFCVVADVLLRATSGAACDGNAAALTPAAVVAAAPVFTRW